MEDRYICYVRDVLLDQRTEWREGEAYHLSLIRDYFQQPIRHEPVWIYARLENGRSYRFVCRSERNDKITVYRSILPDQVYDIIFCRENQRDLLLAIHS